MKKITPAEGMHSETEMNASHAHVTYDNRRQLDLVLAAYHLIAERGFEQLRTRDIAARAGMSIANLHYYFASKEDLIHSVVDYLHQQFVTVHTPAFNMSTGTPLEQIRMQFADVQFRLREKREMIIVMNELYLRALRDPALQTRLKGLDDQWQHYFETVLNDGIQQGMFRKDLNPRAAASVLIAFLKGITYSLMVYPATVNFVEACAELERWLTG